MGRPRIAARANAAMKQELCPHLGPYLREVMVNSLQEESLHSIKELHILQQEIVRFQLRLMLQMKDQTFDPLFLLWPQQTQRHFNLT